ncbi:hypothetical protein Q8A67_020736 [Cirrhinus molitorella]|uniref:Uncharacterized protein n=1 Tax=Cirrhinus molitorella TaxID=172907 RepID=A0AA88PK10_9TELE|nr:hypothetical protein Q8A67_020736 [Cirrhinus molitorella]
MLLLLTALSLCLTRGLLQPEIVSPGPASGIVLREQPGLLITNCRTHTQKVYVRLDPRDVYRAHYPRAVPQALQALDQMPALTNLQVVRSWTATDTALCLSTAIGYALTLGLAFILYRKVNEMQEVVCRYTAAFPRTFERHRREKSTPAEPEVTLIEIDTLPAHHRTEDK